MSSTRIKDYEIWRLELPAGRVIGDSNCRYEWFDGVALCLKTNQGYAGWGYGITCSKGVFTRPAFYIEPIVPLVELRREF